MLNLDENEKDKMFDLAGKERGEVSPDLTKYIMNENIPHLRTALRKAKKKGLGDEFWKMINDEIDKK